MLRVLLAPNPSPMTLQGTQTYIIGRQRAAIIDPGPLLGEHMDAVTNTIGDGVTAFILLTHSHPDHAEGAAALSERLQAPVLSAAQLSEGQRLQTDEGDLVALFTPGHTADHYSFWWEHERAVFCGDLMMGGLDTALVAPPEGDLADYLASLERLAALDPLVIHPAHGPPIRDPAQALERYRRHRMQRVEQVLAGLAGRALTETQLTAYVYGTSIDPGLQPYARAAIDAYLGYLEKHGRVRRGRAGWEKLT